MVRDTTSRIQTRQLRNHEIDSIKFVLLFCTVFMMCVPLMSGNMGYESYSNDPPVIQNDIAPAEGNYLTIQLSASSDYIAVGNVSSYRGFAYSDDAADILRFVDPINDVTLNQSVESGALEEKTISASDIDDDGSTEFMILNYNGSAYNLLVVDFNDATTTKYNVSVSQPTGISTGYFNADTHLDVAVFVRYGVLTLDLQTDQVLGNFSFSGFALDCYAIGRFLEPTQDSIALGIYTSSKDGNLSIVAGNGTIMQTMMMHTEIYGAAKFRYGGGLDDLALMMFDGNLTALSPSTMTSLFNTTGHPERSVVTTGFLNHDGQEDLMIAPTMSNYSVFIDGSNGEVIRQTEEISGAIKGPATGDPPSPLLNYGQIDADNLTDYATLTEGDGNLAFLRGKDGTFGYEEPTITTKPSQILVYDLNENSKDDIIVLESLTVYVVLSDIQEPLITPEPLSPPHPTIHDDYVKIEVGIEEETSIILAEIYLRHDNGNWTQPIEELQNSGSQYFAFLVGLAEGFYDYYLVFQDSYLNIGTLGNETHPMNFTVAGHLAWTASKSLDTGMSHHVMDIGNTSDGGEVIYTLDSINEQVYLDRYTPRGDNETLGLVANRTFSSFYIYTGMMDGDNVLDPVILLYNATSRTINVSVYHGSSGLFWFSSQHPSNLTIPHSPRLFDCDNDGIDEFFFVSEHYFNHSYAPAYLIQLDGTDTWSNVSITGQDAETYGLTLTKTINQNSVEACVSASTGPVDIINASSMTLLSTHNVTSPSHITTIPVGSFVYNNGSEPMSKFLLYLYFIDVEGYSMGYHVFDAIAPRINETTLFTINDIIFTAPMLIDVDGDGTDEIIGVDYFTGDLSLVQLSNPAGIVWSVPISTSDFLSSIIIDFDGDNEEEIGVFTKQDELLTIVSLDGVVERAFSVGQGYGSARLSNIDLGYGEEIVAYPLVRNGMTKIGVIRDVVLIRRLNASLSYTPTDILQGDSLDVNVDVTNIYSEVITDAEVFLTVHYKSGESIINQTKALIYGASNYSTTIAVTWPIGIANLSLSVNHILYDPWEEYYPNALTVRSPLDVVVHTRDIVMQNGTFSANITVSDSFGVRIPDATVSVDLNGTDYAAIYSDGQYRLTIPNIDIIPGEYRINATADHVFAQASAWSSTLFRVETNEIQIDRNMPEVIEQDEQFFGWLNISDMFTNPIEEAHVFLIGANLEITLEELVPGCYFLNSTATIGLGDHSFDIYIEHEYLQGSSFGEFNITTIGDLLAEVPEIPPVDGGELFNVTIFINDNHGTTPSDTWVMVEIDGRNVTATRVSGASFRAKLNATYPMGRWNFTVYYGSPFSPPKQLVGNLFVLSTATTWMFSEDDWKVEQTDSTSIEVLVEDWLSTPVQNAYVAVLVRGTTYTLEHIENGLYQTDISTTGWPHQVYPIYLTVDHEYLYLSQSSGNLTVIAKPMITILPSTVEPVQFSVLNIEVEVTDLYENPVSGLEVFIEFASMSQIAEETPQRGTYSATFDVGNTYHSWYNISVIVNGELAVQGSGNLPVYVEVFTPEMSALSTNQISIAAGISLLLSLIGMVLFVKISSAISTTPRKEDDVTNSIGQMDRIYGVLVITSAMLFIHSWTLFTTGSYIYALIESILLLGSSVLLYGLWLYRDAYSSILQEGSLSRKRIALGVWHLLLVPFIVFLIFIYGAQLEHFQRYILEVPQFVIGDISIPPLLATILATYMSSIVVVVISFYREIRKGLNRIDDMVSSGTPSNVVDEEQALLIGRTGSSIRIKFLMFLLILGATTTMQLEFLRNYSMAAIVLIPVVFLVLIPFISSRIVKGVPKLIQRFRGSGENEYTLSSLED